MLCFVSPALAGSSFTYAEHPDSPFPVIWYSSLSSKNQVDTSEQQGGGTCQSEVKKEAEGRMTRTAACAAARLRSHPLRCLRPTQAGRDWHVIISEKIDKIHAKPVALAVFIFLFQSHVEDYHV